MAGSPGYPRHERSRPAYRRAPLHLPFDAEEARLEAALLAGVEERGVLARALHCAEAQGVFALDALIACTGADVDRITQRLAARLGIDVLTAIDFAADVLPATAASAAFQSGLLRLPGNRFIAALRGRPAIELCRLLQGTPEAAGRVRLASPAMFTAAVLHGAGRSLAEDAASRTERIDPAFSARSKILVRTCAAGAGTIGVLAIGAIILAPLGASFGFGAVFMTLTGLRLLATLHDPAARPCPRMPDDALPVYTVLVPLYRERACLAGLIEALCRLDYPEAKLDIKLLVEAGDTGTRTALEATALPNHFEILAVPPGEPRTKPRALNVGLTAARGALLAVFDAEDRPEPDQLRIAVEAFRKGGARLACVQARLAIDNARDGWLTRIFALEYAGLFDALLPALSRSRLLFPLGGTSNHFRTALLERIGGWDAWNVTEDADLGIRLARMGFRCRVIRSTTYEEAPNTTGAWLRQRTRWLKGYMLTWAVHMRQPARLYRELGLLNFLAFHAFIGGIPMSALILPVFILGIVIQASTGLWPPPGGGFGRILPFLMDVFNLSLGFGTAMALVAIGADRRGLKQFSIWIPTVPGYWLLSSVAAWRAVWQLARAPFLWEKTEHGLARTSESAPGE